jgi:transposase InsO family protein
MEFVAEVLAGEKNISQICREYEITRKTGYKWLERARAGERLSNKRRGPPVPGNKTAESTENLIVDARFAHPAWGARKLKKHLENQGFEGLPAQSTICEILKRNGLVSPEDSASHTPHVRFEKAYPNQMWQTDFKGDFGLLNEQRCHALTALDDHSRYALCLEAKDNQRFEGVHASFLRLFNEHGLPESILCDNGSPWGDNKSGSITQFDVWMMLLDILPIHIRPYRPQTQGKEERFHRTLKEEVLKRQAFADIPCVQKRFDQWRNEYNHERPHHALDLNTPGSRYRPSPRSLPKTLQYPEYDMGKNLRRVNYKGYIVVNRHRYYLTEALAGKLLEIKPLAGDDIALCFGRFRVAVINLDERIYTSRRIYRDDAENGCLRSGYALPPPSVFDPFPLVPPS